MKAIRNMLLQPTLELNFELALISAVEKGKTEMVRWLFEQTTDKINTIPSQRSKSSSYRESITMALRKAYKLNHKEISLILLEFASKDIEQWAMLNILIAEEMSKNDEKDENYIDYLLSLSSADTVNIAILRSSLEQITKPVVIDPKTSVYGEMRKYYPNFLAPRIFKEIENQLKTLKIGDELARNYLQNQVDSSKACWSVFVDDFETFKPLVTKFETLLDGNSGQIPLLEFVVFRTAQRNLRLDFFNHCMNVLIDGVRLQNPDSSKVIHFNRAIEFTVQFKRLDLFRRLLNVRCNTNDQVWHLELSSLLSEIVRVGDMPILKKFIENREIEGKHSVVAVGVLEAIQHQNVEVLNYLMNLLPSSIFFSLQGSEMLTIWKGLVASGNIDMMKRPFYLKFLNSYPALWKQALMFAVDFQDENAIQVITNLKENLKVKPLVDLTLVHKFATQLPQPKLNEHVVALLNQIIERWTPPQQPETK